LNKKITFIADYFIDEISGGAELSDGVLADYLDSKNWDVKKVKCQDFNPNHHNADTFIISNFATLSAMCKDWFINSGCKYIVIERDQKYVLSRNTAMYPNFIAPKSQVTNESFYVNAHKVFCLTNHSQDILLAHIDLKNTYALGCTQFSETQLDILQKSLDIKKSKKNIFAITAGKRSDLAKGYCQKTELEYEVLGESGPGLQEKLQYEDFIPALAQYGGIVFFSHAVETCCRLLIEAKVLGLKIITDNKNGCTYEDWWSKYKGRELLDFLKVKVQTNLKEIESEL